MGSMAAAIDEIADGALHACYCVIVIEKHCSCVRYYVNALLDSHNHFRFTSAACMPVNGSCDCDPATRRIYSCAALWSRHDIHLR